LQVSCIFGLKKRNHVYSHILFGLVVGRCSHLLRKVLGQVLNWRWYWRYNVGLRVLVCTYQVMMHAIYPSKPVKWTVWSAEKILQVNIRIWNETDMKTRGTEYKTQIWIQPATPTWFLTKLPKSNDGKKAASLTNVAGKLYLHT
jgi:hypothetical protein